MRCLLLPVYSSFFISVISSPISSDSNDLYLEDTTTDLDLTGTQTPPPRSVSGISVAYNNVDPTTESDFKDQSGSTYVATTQQVSTVPIPSSWVAQLPDVEICKKRVKGKTVQTCMISGIDCKYEFWISTAHPCFYQSVYREVNYGETDQLNSRFIGDTLGPVLDFVSPSLAWKNSILPTLVSTNLGQKILFSLEPWLALRSSRSY